MYRVENAVEHPGKNFCCSLAYFTGHLVTCLRTVIVFGDSYPATCYADGLMLACVVAMFILPESPRWLVTQGELDKALAVIHQVYTRNQLPSGAQQSTAEVEQELMELWSSVEKERDAVRESKLAAHQQSIAKRAAKVCRLPVCLPVLKPRHAAVRQAGTGSAFWLLCWSGLWTHLTV